MAVLTYKLKASSLPEVIVASVILMLIFTLTLDILARIGSGKDETPDQLAAEFALRHDFTGIADAITAPCSVTREYEWGEIRAEVKVYREKLCEITLTATFYKNKRKIIYKWLARSKGQDILAESELIIHY